MRTWTSADDYRLRKCPPHEWALVTLRGRRRFILDVAPDLEGEDVILLAKDGPVRVSRECRIILEGVDRSEEDLPLHDAGRQVLAERIERRLRATAESVGREVRDLFLDNARLLDEVLELRRINRTLVGDENATRRELLASVRNECEALRTSGDEEPASHAVLLRKERRRSARLRRKIAARDETMERMQRQYASLEARLEDERAHRSAMETDDIEPVDDLPSYPLTLETEVP